MSFLIDNASVPKIQIFKMLEIITMFFNDVWFLVVVFIVYSNKNLNFIKIVIKIKYR